MIYLERNIMKKIVIHVEGGLVQAVYADTERNIEVEVLDLDVPSYPTEEEIAEIQEKRTTIQLEQERMVQIY
jgi:hypothetical protein